MASFLEFFSICAHYYPNSKLNHQCQAHKNGHQLFRFVGSCGPGQLLGGLLNWKNPVHHQAARQFHSVKMCAVFRGNDRWGRRQLSQQRQAAAASITKERSCSVTETNPPTVGCSSALVYCTRSHDRGPTGGAASCITGPTCATCSNPYEFKRRCHFDWSG